jgi:hypothetical protein
MPAGADIGAMTRARGPGWKLLWCHLCGREALARRRKRAGETGCPQDAMFGEARENAGVLGGPGCLGRAKSARAAVSCARGEREVVELWRDVLVGVER